MFTTPTNVASMLLEDEWHQNISFSWSSSRLFNWNSLVVVAVTGENGFLENNIFNFVNFALCLKADSINLFVHNQHCKNYLVNQIIPSGIISSWVYPLVNSTNRSRISSILWRKPHHKAAQNRYCGTGSIGKHIELTLNFKALNDNSVCP